MYLSFWNNPLIKMGKESFLWISWLNRKVARISDLYSDGLFQSRTLAKI